MAASSWELLFSPGRPSIMWQRGVWAPHQFFSAVRLYPQPTLATPSLLYCRFAEMLHWSRFCPYRTQVNGVWFRNERTDELVQMQEAQLVWASTDQNVEGVVAIVGPR